MEGLENRVLLSDVSFEAARMFYTGSGPYSVAVGDFNGDGKSDLAVANEYSYTVSILIGNGDRTFQAKTDYIVGCDPNSVVVRDFNGDGKSDLAVANWSSNTVSILLGNGDGSFQAKTDYAVGNGARSVTVGDFNGDGKSDLAVASDGSNTVGILLGNGGGGFQARTDYAVGNGARSVTVGDFNGDGKSDLAVASDGSNTVGILLGNGDGSFQAKTEYAAGNAPWSVAVGDFDGDGKSDLVVANWLGGTVSILRGKGDGSFQAKTDYDVWRNPSSVTMGDFNGDGKSDLAVANYGSDTVSILLGNGDGSFQAKADYAVGPLSQSVTVGDFNGDGKSDLAVANYGSDTVNILLGNGDGSFQAKSDYAVGNGATSVTVGDFNGDGKSDLATANYGSNTVSILLDNGDGSFQAKTDCAVGSRPLSVATGDFNGDGKRDLAVANSSDNTVSILLGIGDGSFRAKTDYVVGSSPARVAVGDFNGDGESDLAVANWTSNTVSILLGNGDGSFQANTDYATSSSVYYTNSVTVADFNGDGNSDLAVTNEGDGVRILLGNGDGGFQAEPYFDAGSSPISVTTEDFNGDGKSDLAIVKLGIWTDVATVYILLGNGDGSFQAETYYAVEGALDVTAKDFNGDGKSDLATANLDYGDDYSAGTVSILLGNGDGSFQTKTDYAVGNGTSSVAVGDFNGDGKLDLAAVNSGSDTVSILLNNTQTVLKTSTTTNIAASADRAIYGQSVTLTGTVASTSGTPGGTIRFCDGATLLGTGTLDATGKATLIRSNLAAGSHSLSVSYSGDDRYSGSVSPTLGMTVDRDATAMGLSVSAAPSVFGQAIKFVATVDAVAPAAGTPTGTAQFQVDGVNSGGPVPLINGSATSSILSSLAIGDHSITAIYSGDANFSASTGTMTQTVRANQAPTDLTLSMTTVLRKWPASTLVGTLSATDPDAGDAVHMTYALVGGAGATNNAMFTIVENQLKTRLPIPSTAPTSYSIRVRTTDSGNLSYDKIVTIKVAGTNAAPTDIRLTSAKVVENKPAGTVVGTLSATDANAGESFTYSLVSGTGSTDNSKFTISGSQLKTRASFNYEAKKSYTIRIRAKDKGGLYLDKAFTISVTNVNETPTGIKVSASTVAEHKPAGTVVGTLSATDPDIGNTFSYSLVNGAGVLMAADDAAFKIVSTPAGVLLETNARLNYDTKSVYNLILRVKDQGGLFCDRPIRVTVHK